MALLQKWWCEASWWKDSLLHGGGQHPTRSRNGSSSGSSDSSRSSRSGSISDIDAGALELDVALRVPLVLAQFQAYCERTHCTESLEFILRADGLSRLQAGSEELICELQTIAMEFCTPGGDKEINVGSSTREQALELVEKNDASAFAACYLQVYHMLASGVWPRFLASPECLKVHIGKHVLAAESRTAEPSPSSSSHSLDAFGARQPSGTL
ncbi:RGS domain-containing protein [Tribonema minus]|uniref:RGS domain-containing protein n=1 Tax=Tribonema minus TaxID=303371 RepID=A0A835Z8E7_9STRA|nr:RGS domain-containing protein [Tribonema minus]